LTVCSAIAQSGLVDPTFRAGVDIDGPIQAIALAPDGKVYVAGGFTNIDGVARRGVARLLPNGMPDSGFESERLYTSVVRNSHFNALALQADGKLLVGGTFPNTTLNTLLVRLEPDGKIDPLFHALTDVSAFGTVVSSVAIAPDGKILVAALTNIVLASSPANYFVARLLPDGSPDPEFIRPGDFDGQISVVSSRSNGKILIGGSFTTIGGVARDKVVQLNADGSLDLGFDPGAAALPASTVEGVLALAASPDGTIIVAGSFHSLGSKTIFGVARLNPNGTVADDFKPELPADVRSVNAFALKIGGGLLLGGEVNPILSTRLERAFVSEIAGDGRSVNRPTLISNLFGRVLAMSSQSDGSILFAGDGRQQWLGRVTPQKNGFIYRLRSGVECDDSFNPTGPNGAVEATAQLQDGRLLLGGFFTRYNEKTNAYLVRVFADGRLDDSFKTIPSMLSPVSAITIYPDGRILVGEQVTVDNPSGITRLLPDGHPDPSFGSVLKLTLPSLNSREPRPLRGFALLPDDKILVAGIFVGLGNLSYQGLVRLNSDGSPDTNFPSSIDLNRTTRPTAGIYRIATNTDTSIIVSGLFKIPASSVNYGAARFNADGSLNRALPATADLQSHLSALVADSDGSIVVGGAGKFPSPDGVSRFGAVRLSPSGLIDTNFSLQWPIASPSVDSVAIQADQKLLVSGLLYLSKGTGFRDVARYFRDGSLDTNFLQRGGFPPGLPPLFFGDNLDVLHAQPDGRTLVAGTFLSANGVARNFVCRLQGDGPGPQPPTIDQQIPGGAVRAGEPFSLSVNASGTAPVSYLWRRGDTYLPNQTNATINLPSFQASDAGDYSVLVFNHAGVAESQIARVMLDESPEIRLSLVRRKPDEPLAFELRLSGSAIPDLLIEASSDLRLWKPILTNATGLDPFNFDTRTAGYSEPMFIRARTK
jgi:uncharacterized delta-60 repeat protein